MILKKKENGSTQYQNHGNFINMVRKKNKACMKFVQKDMKALKEQHKHNRKN